MPSVFEYIDFGWPPGLIQITEFGGIRRVRARNPAWLVAVYAIIRLNLATPPAPWLIAPAIHQLIGHQRPPKPAAARPPARMRGRPKSVYSETAPIAQTIGKN